MCSAFVHADMLVCSESTGKSVLFQAGVLFDSSYSISSPFLCVNNIAVD